MYSEKKYFKKLQKEQFKKYEKLVRVPFFGNTKRLIKVYSTLKYDSQEIKKRYEDKFFPQCDKKWAEEEYQRTLNELRRSIINEYLKKGIIFGIVFVLLLVLVFILF